MAKHIVKCLKCGELDQLSIYGIDYVTENIPDAYVPAYRRFWSANRPPDTRLP